MSFTRSSFPIKRTGLKSPHSSGASILLACVAVFLASASMAQETSPDASARPVQTERKTYAEENGTETLTRTIETERHLTSDGEVEIQRVRSPSWTGDDTVTSEREVRTKKLPDGTIEKTYITRRPDGARELTPVQVVHERIMPGKDSSTIESQTFQPDGRGEWRPLEKETVTEKGPDSAKQIIKEIEQTDATGAWRTVERQISSTHTSTSGKETHKETQSVRQGPDSYGGLSDYERREERTTRESGVETQEVTLQRRDTSTTDSRQFFLVEHTRTESAGTERIVRHTVTKSDLLLDGTRNFYSSHPEIVEERTEVDPATPNGTKQLTVTVSGRTAGDPNAVRPVYTVVQQTDRGGYVRQVFIPAR